MTPTKNGFAALLLCCILASCSTLKKSTTVPPTPRESTDALSDSLIGIYRASATKTWELVHTGIDIRLHIKEQTASGTTRLTLHPYYYATDSLVLDAKAMTIESVTTAGQPLHYTYDTLQLKIKLPQRYSRKDTLQLEVRYQAMPYAFAAGGSDAIKEDRGLYFVNADGKEPYQPVQVWTQGETEANSHWFPTFDKTNFRSAFDITIHIPDSFKTLSNGLLVQSVKEGDGWRADSWKQAVPIPPYLAMMAVGNFAVTKDSWKGKEVSYYVPQQYGAFAKDIFARTPDMIEFYTNLLKVPFPWDKYSQVVTYDYVSGAMENVSASLFGAFNLKDKRQIADDNNDFIVAHELFHQWFGDYVTAESWSNLTLNESFADYGEYLWAEHRYGKPALQLAWIQGQMKYLGQARRNDPPLVRYHYLSHEDMFDRVSYSKGGLILHYLRQLTGDEAFFDALHLYLEQNALRSAEASQLRLAIEQVTGKDWNWFFDQWYYRGGHPKLSIRYRYDDAGQRLEVNVSQTQSDSAGIYILPLKAQLISGGQVSETDWYIDRKEQTFRYPYRNGQRPVLVPDAGHWLPGELEDNKTVIQWKSQFEYSNDRISKRQAVMACALLRSNDTAQQVLESALSDTDPYIRNLAINLKTYEAGKKLPDTWIAKLAHIATFDQDNRARASALIALGLLKNEAYAAAYQHALDDSSYQVAAAGLYALDQVNHKQALEQARALKPETMMGNNLLYTAADVIAKEGLPADYDFFEQKLLHLFEGMRSYFLDAFKSYMLQLKDEAAFGKGVALLSRLSDNKKDSPGGLFTASILYRLQVNADKQVKLGTDRAAVDEAKSRREVAAAAWQRFKESLTDEELKEAAARYEKE
ncbi:M1 family metallopeptidase [Taibaiella koreensis]|uniref:M1 family metallopeptidase n=1 Tax=Taibaiella koreensis TaxID=1268548 RepID=UPI000E59AD94|nr:M1 family aminopeptidase [Taibaiella koreensis]